MLSLGQLFLVLASAAAQHGSVAPVLLQRQQSLPLSFEICPDEYIRSFTSFYKLVPWFVKHRPGTIHWFMRSWRGKCRTVETVKTNSSDQGKRFYWIAPNLHIRFSKDQHILRQVRHHVCKSVHVFPRQLCCVWPRHVLSSCAAQVEIHSENNASNASGRNTSNASETNGSNESGSNESGSNGSAAGPWNRSFCDGRCNLRRPLRHSITV